MHLIIVNIGRSIVNSMFVEVYANKYLQFLYDKRTGEFSIGWHPCDLTEYEKYILFKIFDLNNEDIADDD